jgi:hypothetical protein
MNRCLYLSAFVVDVGTLEVKKKRKKEASVGCGSTHFDGTPMLD